MSVGTSVRISTYSAPQASIVVFGRARSREATAGGVSTGAGAAAPSALPRRRGDGMAHTAGRLLGVFDETGGIRSATPQPALRARDRPRRGSPGPAVQRRRAQLTVRPDASVSEDQSAPVGHGGRRPTSFVDTGSTNDVERRVSQIRAGSLTCSKASPRTANLRVPRLGTLTADHRSVPAGSARTAASRTTAAVERHAHGPRGDRPRSARPIARGSAIDRQRVDRPPRHRGRARPRDRSRPACRRHRTARTTVARSL